MADLRVTVATRRGQVLGELEPLLEEISWRLNGVGRLRMSLSRTDAKATADLLRFGNIILAQFENGLPDWGGVIDPPREWGPEGRIEINAYSGEYLLGMRQTNRGRYFSQARVGRIFRAVILDAANVFPLIVDLGQVWAGGGSHSPDYHFRNLLSIAQDSIGKRLTPADFVLTPVLAAGQIRFRAELFERRGRDKPGTALVEGANLGQVRLLEQGQIVNYWAVVGEGTTWGDDRPMAFAQDTESIATFGLREGSAVFAGTKEAATLQATADELLAQTAQPHVMLELEALDKKPALFADYDLGDALRVHLPSYGFGGYNAMVRLHGRDYSPQRGTCTLVVREKELLED